MHQILGGGEKFQDFLFGPIGIFSMVIVFSTLSYFMGKRIAELSRRRWGSKEEAKQYLDKALKHAKKDPES